MRYLENFREEKAVKLQRNDNQDGPWYFIHIIAIDVPARNEDTSFPIENPKFSQNTIQVQWQSVTSTTLRKLICQNYYLKDTYSSKV